MKNIHDGQRIIKGKIGKTTSTCYSNESGDGSVESGAASNNWNSAHDATTGSHVPSTATTDVGSMVTGGGFAQIDRVFLPFDTSGLPDTDNIDTATLGVYVTGVNNDDNDSDDFINVAGPTTQASTSSLSTDDFETCGDAIDNPTEGATLIDLGSFTTSQYNSFVLNPTGEGWISKTDYTKLGLREGHDILDSGPISEGSNKINRLIFSAADQAGTTQDPKLVVEHSSEGGAPTAVRK